MFVIPEKAQAQYRTIISMRKTCGHCGMQVPNSSQVGDKCPHCGVIWGRENTTTSTQNFSYLGSTSPTPLWFSFSINRYSSGFIDDNMPFLYGKSSGNSYGFEFGFGPENQSKWFMLLRYRNYSRAGIRSNFDWNQYFFEIGGRYHGISRLFNFAYPIVGFGVGFTKEHSPKDFYKNPYGLGLYLEGGMEFRLTKGLSISGVMEYATYHLVYKDEYGEPQTFGTDGDLYLRVNLILSFNRRQ
jgi:predicted RNA-binding Zn-ribbon protein involved in translation (DUF1610 family)